jgi:hypothetical protein
MCSHCVPTAQWGKTELIKREMREASGKSDVMHIVFSNLQNQSNQVADSMRPSANPQDAWLTGIKPLNWHSGGGAENFAMAKEVAKEDRSKHVAEKVVDEVKKGCRHILTLANKSKMENLLDVLKHLWENARDEECLRVQVGSLKKQCKHVWLCY